MALQVIAIKITTKTLYIFMCFYIYICMYVCILYVKNVHFFFVQSYVYTDIIQ